MNYMMRFAGISAVLLVSGCLPMQQPAGQPYALGTQQVVPTQQIPTSIPTPVGLPTAGVATEAVLADMLVGKLGISQPQALGGLGSIFSLAQQRMTPGDFSTLSTSVPNMNQYLSAAPQPIAPSQSSALLGAAGTLLGGQASTIGALAGSFQSLGMQPSMISQFLPLVFQYLQTQNGGVATTLLQSALY